MNKKDLIKQLNTEMSALPIPNVLDRVREKSNIVTADEAIFPQTVIARKPLILRVMPAFMAFVLLAMVLASSLMPLNLSYTTLTLDINPSIELTLNTREEVVQVRAVNNDSATFLQNLHLNGKHYAIAIQNILTKAIEQNYIRNTNDNAIILSVASRNQNAKAVYQNNVQFVVNNVLANNSRIANIIMEDYEKDVLDEYNELRQNFEDAVNITPAKYMYIKRVVNRFPALEGHEEYLSKMSVGELFKLMNNAPGSNTVNEIIDRVINNIPSPNNNQNGTGGIGN